MKTFRVPVAVIFFFSLTVIVQANVIVGLPAGIDGNCIPFGCPETFGLNTYQEVYSATAFAGPIDITGINFFDTVSVNGLQPASGTFSFSLSYSSKAPGALDSTNPANNISFGSQAFFSGSLPGVSSSIMGVTGTPFLYDPALGNLLLTVGISGASNPQALLFLDRAQDATVVSRAYFGNSNSAVGPGLITEFVTTVPTVPEPTSLLLVVTGLGTLGIAAWRRNK